MSDDEDVQSGSDVDEEQEAEAKTLIKKKIAAEHSHLDEVAKDILEANAEERRKMEQEIKEMKKKSEARKKEREMEEKRLTQERAAEEARRKAEEEDRKRKKEEEEQKKREARAKKTAEYEMMKNPPKRNFVISKKADTGDDEEKTEESADSGAGEKKSKEQLEAEKRAILGQRIQALNIDGFDAGQLKEKAKELHALLSRLESEKYDLEKRFKGQQFDMLELAEKARNMNKVGRGSFKRVDTSSNENDKLAERFAGAPPRVVMYSEFERQKDKRSYTDRKDLYVGPLFGYPAERVKPTKQLVWGEDGLPQYVNLGGEAGGHGGEGHE